jgi:hypothetical protein
MPRPHIPKPLRRQVLTRARSCCEYCLIHQDDRPDTHQFDHVLAVKHGGLTVSENLALACAWCNNYKGSDLASMDPLEQTLAALYNPRTDLWGDHFTLSGATILGLTPTGRATAQLLRFNDPERLRDREELLAAGRYPPPRG